MPYPSIEDYPYLKFEFGSLSVTLDKLRSYNREPLHGAKIDYAFSGNEIIKRVPHEPKFLWNLTALVDWTTRKEFLLIANLADRKIYQPPFSGYKLILSDVFLSIPELTITRPKADPFQEIGARLGEIEYFAKFYVGIDVSTIKEQPEGIVTELSFTMNELEKLTI
jgi:hypothetical protein